METRPRQGCNQALCAFKTSLEEWKPVNGLVYDFDVFTFKTSLEEWKPPIHKTEIEAAALLKLP